MHKLKPVLDTGPADVLALNGHGELVTIRGASVPPWRDSESFLTGMQDQQNKTGFPESKAALRMYSAAYNLKAGLNS